MVPQALGNGVFQNACHLASAPGGNYEVAFEGLIHYTRRVLLGGAPRTDSYSMDADAELQESRSAGLGC